MSIIFCDVRGFTAISEALKSTPEVLTEVINTLLTDLSDDILACGGIENSRILLWTREKNKNLINENLPIGQYWMNHPWIISGIGVINKKKLL